MEILLKKTGDTPQDYDGRRYLIESTWPENVQDWDLGPYRWVQELVPSCELIAAAQKHRWHHDQVQRLYWAELEQPKAQAALQQLLAENQDGHVTFLYGGDDGLKSYAASLRKYITTHGAALAKVPEPLLLAA